MGNLYVNNSRYTVVTRKTMGVKEMADMYGIGINKAYEIANSDGFPAIRVGKKILVITSKMDSWIEEHIGSKL